LEYLVGFVVAIARVDATNDRKLIQHRGLLRQVFANLNAGEFALYNAKWAAIFVGTIGFGIPGVNVASGLSMLSLLVVDLGWHRRRLVAVPPEIFRVEAT
jgi:hypothetical protein